jgi:cobalamin biosynthesis protein CobT
MKAAKSSPAEKDMLNYFCDIRIEREIAKKYGGTETFLVRLRDKVADRTLSIIEKVPPFPMLCFGVAEAMRGKRHDVIFNHASFGPIITAIAGKYVSRLNQATSTGEIHAVCLEILEEIKEMSKNHDESSEKGETDVDAKEQGDAGGEKGQGQGSSGGKSDGGQESGEGERSETGDGQVGEGSKEDGKSSSGKPGSGSPERSLQESVESHQEGKAQGTVEEHIDKSIKKIMKRMESGEPSGRNSHNHEINVARGRESIPTTTSFDEEINHSGDRKFDEAYRAIRSRILPTAVGVRNKIERALAARTIEQKVPLQKRGKLDRKKLARFSTDPEFDKPFFRTDSNVVGKAAVSVLVDLSGSMGGSKINNARLAAAAMGEALKALGLPFEILGFECFSDSKMSRFSAKTSGRHFNRRDEILSHKIFKSFDTDSLAGVAAIKSGNNNADGESVLWAARRLEGRRETRKILIVLSDGNPVADGDQSVLYDDLKTKIEKIERSGIECVGIGISTDVVKKFYKDYVVLNSIEGLATGCASKLADILLKKAK